MKPGDRYQQVWPPTRDIVEVEAPVDAKLVAVRRENGARQTFPISTLIDERYWRRVPAMTGGER